MGISETITCDLCTKTISSSEKREIIISVAGTEKVWCWACKAAREDYADNISDLDFKDANISVTFNAAGTPIAGEFTGGAA